MFPAPLSFIDLETTGVNPRFDRVIEIGVLRVDGETITETFSTLLNPHTYLPPEITRITGIHSEDLTNAPSFSEIKEKLQDLLDGTIFVAHNARFDYGFLKHEFLRHNEKFSSKIFCTLRLARTLFPTLPRHSLEALINHFDLPAGRRHRALDDATAMYHFVQKAMKEEGFEKISKAILKKTSLPIHLTKQDVNVLPETPGVYLFYGDTDFPLYIGKSKNIKDRVLSHFASDIVSSTEMKITQQIKRIEFRETAGELGALVLESNLIKQMMPMYNKKLRHSRKLIALKKRIDDKGYERIYKETFVNGEPIEDVADIVGICKSERETKELLYQLAKDHSLCPKLLGIEKTSTACFYNRLGYCQGACIEKESPLRYNIRMITAFDGLKIAKWPFDGTIAIEEESLSGRKDYLLVNNWYVTGIVSVDENGNKNETEATEGFDVDIYKILKSFLKNKLNSVKILTNIETTILNRRNEEYYST